MLNTNDYIKTDELPHRRLEAWKFSSIKSWLDNKSYSTNKVDLKDLLTNKLPEAKITEFSDWSKLEKTFSFAQHDAVKKFALNAETKAYKITIPTATQSELKLDFINDETSSFKNTVLIFNIEAQAEFKYLANITSAPESFQTMSHYFVLEQNARVSFGRVQDQDSTSAHLGYDHAVLDRDAHFEICSLNLGAKLSRNNIDVSIAGVGAHATVNGIYITDEERQSDTYSHIHHHAAHTTSTQLYKGILSDESKGIFTGRIHVHRDSQLINSEQLNRVLLLSPKAQSHSQPQLEIFADDVKCSHGSTTGQLSQEEIFYLQSRGINPKKSSEMIARGFAFDVLFKLESTWLRDNLNTFLKKAVN